MKRKYGEEHKSRQETGRVRKGKKLRRKRRQREEGKEKELSMNR